MSRLPRDKSLILKSLELEPSHIARLYDKIQRYIVPGYDILSQRMARLAGRNQPSNFTVLDLGCGTGNLAYELLRQYPQATIICLDRSSDALKLAQNKLRSVSNGRARFLQKDFTEEPLVGSYNAVVSSFALHHLPESRIPTLLGQIHTALVPDGVCLFGDTIHITSTQRFETIRMRYKRFLQKNISKGYITQDEVNERSAIMNMLSELGFNLLKPIRLPVVLDMLESAGFRDVKCTFQDGNLAVFGGMK